MTPIAKMSHSFLDLSGRKWVYLDIDDPVVQDFQGHGIVELEDLPDLLLRHGLESAYAGLYEAISLDWTHWFTQRSNLPEGPSRASYRESLQVVDKALVIFERYYEIQTCRDAGLTLDYLYTHFMRVMGLERNVEFADLTQWELNLLTTIQMTFAGMLMSYLNSDIDLNPDMVVPAVLFKLNELFSGVSSAMDFAVNNLADNLNEFGESYK